ncbi:MAG: MgtC/SapB family protein [Burkholderiaceae bacterium]
MEAALPQLSMHPAELALRMVVGVVLGGLIGWERNVEDRHFGLRIHMLTSLAAAGFSVAALETVDRARLQNSEADPFRILEAVLSGVALLAAGTIIKGDGQVKGLTTRVGLWLAGAIGVAAGAGICAVAVFIATLSFAILYGLRKRPQQRPLDEGERAEDGGKMPKESES